MGRSRSSAALLGLMIEQVRIEDGGVAAVARSRDVGSACPSCSKLSRRVHSRYMRSLSDLPAHGRRVRIALTVRRFRCENDGCLECAPAAEQDHAAVLTGKANAGGRLLGTLLSGLTYQVGGLALMLGTAAVLVALSALAAGRLSPDSAEEGAA
jgi:hypothetical protein